MNKVINVVRKHCYDIIYIVLWLGFLVGLIKVGSYPYVILQNVGLYFSVMMILIISMLLRRDKIISKEAGFIALAYFVVAITYLVINLNSWGNDLFRMVYFKVAMWGAIIIIMLFILKNGIVFDEKKYNIKILMFMVFAFSLVYIFAEKEVSIVLVLIPFYFAPITKEEWNKQMVYLSIAMYVTFAYQMTKSFIVAPNEMSGARYVGMFSFPVTIGIMASMAIISVIYLFNRAKEKYTDSKKKYLFSILMILLLVYPSLVIFVVMNRTSIFALTFVLLSLLFIDERSKMDITVKIIITVGVVSLGLLAITLSFFIVKNGLAAKWLTQIDNRFLKKILEYISTVYYHTFALGSSDGVFNEGSFMEALNRFSSGRLGLWVSGIKGATLFGTQDIGVTTPNGSFMPHVHSTYINWIISYGWIIGSLFVIWFFYCVFAILRMYRKGNNEFFLPFLWSQYCLVFCIFERENWGVLSLFLFMILLYPLIQNWGKEAKSI